MMQRQYRSVIVFSRKECSTNRAFVGRLNRYNSPINWHYRCVDQFILKIWPGIGTAALELAVAFIAMYAVGLWMVDLDYYDNWYHRAPELHKSNRMILVGFMLLRLLWKWSQARPADLPDSILLTRIARGLHDGFYLLVPTCLFRDVSIFRGEE